VQDNNLHILTTYKEGFQYLQGKLEFFPTTEGYVKAVYNYGSSTPYFQYVYNYTDHLGNIRLSYTYSDKMGYKILQENHYYPFGLKHQNYTATLKKLKLKQENNNQIITVRPAVKAVYNYKYNGKELQDEFGLDWYDYGARMYDPATARWYSVDQMAEKYFENSNYVYTLNNPIIYIDPNGNEVEMCCDTFKGFLVGTVDNLFGTNYRQSVSVSNTSDFNSGLDVADGVSFVGGSIMMMDGTKNIAAGTLTLATSAELTLASGGLSIEVTAPTAVAGGVLLAEGAAETYAGSALATNAINNFSNRRSESSTSNSTSSERTLNDNLRLDKNGKKIPDPEAAGTEHTQLGTKKGRNGRYRQAREFNSANQEVRDIDFTDHNRPNDHTNPHQHKYSGNGTGNRKRGKAKPLKKINYE